MKKCTVHNVPLTPVGMQLICLKCNPLYARSGFSINLRHLF